METRTDTSARPLAGARRRGIPQCGILVLCFVAGYGEVSRQQVLLDLGMDLYDGAAVTDIV